MEKHIIDQIKYGLRYLPSGFIAGALDSRKAPDADRLCERVGGFMRGVCHPGGDCGQILRANIGWVRFDIPFPFDERGKVTESYERFKKRAGFYRENGLKVMAVTPYPSAFIEAGIDPRCNEFGVVRTAKFFVKDLADTVDAFQITNEMGLPNFTLPLNLDEAARFIGVQAMAMKSVKGCPPIGYNSAGPQADLHVRMKPYLNFCDYVGIDIYIGCFYSLGGYMWMFDALLKYLRGFTGKPIILQEFGYIGEGEPKSAEEKLRILREYGAESEEDARENIDAFVERLPERMREHVQRLAPERGHRGDYIFKSDFVNHLYRELPAITKIPGYPHTPEGQAKFFADLIPRLCALPFVAGAFIYTYSDSEQCYICSQSDCPTETRWGLVDMDGREKPAYYAVQEAFSSIRKGER